MDVFPPQKNHGPWLVAQVVGVSSYNQKVAGLILIRARTSVTGSIPGPGSYDSLACVRAGGNQPMLLSLASMFLFLPSSLPSSLSKSSEKMLLGEDKFFFLNGC